MITALLTIFTGLAGGLAVGGSVVAFFTVLGVVARIIEISGKKEYIKFYEIAIIIGALASCTIYFTELKLDFARFMVIPIGLFMGIFIGMVASALTETLDILSTAVNKLGIAKWLYLIIFVIILGKVFGSLIYFITPGFF